MSLFSDYLAHRRQLAEAEMRHRRLMEAAKDERFAARFFEEQVQRYAFVLADDNRAHRRRCAELASQHATRAAEILREAKEQTP